jgi:hypothetical protein
MAKDADFRSSATRNRYTGVSQIKLEDLADYLQGECDAITADMENLLKESAHELRDKIEQDSPEKHGDYKAGWTVTKRQSAGEVTFVVRNATKYQLTHLLEHGHDNPLVGERTEGIPHINNNADVAIRKCGDDIDRLMKKESL